MDKSVLISSILRLHIDSPIDKKYTVNSLYFTSDSYYLALEINFLLIDNKLAISKVFKVETPGKAITANRPPKR